MKILFAFLIVQSCLQLASSQQPCPDQNLTNGHTLGCSWDGGERQYFCNTGYAVSGPYSRVCVNGSWSGPEPSCQTSPSAFSFADARLDPVYEIFPKFYYAPTGFIPACWISLGLNDANFICRQIGLGEGTSIHRVDLEYNIEINGPFAYADSVSCSSTDMHISECNITSFQIVKSCPDGVLGMTCGPTTRLVYNSMLDRMQLSYRDTTTDLCYDSVDQLTADTYCRLEGKLGGGVRRSVNGSKVGVSVIQELKCAPKMKNFDDCAFKKVSATCSRNYLKIDCLETTVENTLRLVGSRDLHTGNLQIYKGGSWGDVCWEAFYSDEATVACRQLGFDGYLAYPRGVYGDRVGDSYKVERVRCDADAKNFSECEFLPETRCNSPDETVSLWCIYYKDCCAPKITSNNLKPNPTLNTFAHGSFLSFSCDENTVLDGVNTLQCDSGVWSSDIPTCIPAKNNSVRLVDGSSLNEGTVQIFLGNQWHFVCDQYWLYSAATKICENIGYNGALQLTYFNYFQSTNPKQPLSSLECPNRDNATLSECSINSTNCSIEEAAGVICGNLHFKARLFGGRVTEGRAQIYFNGNWLDVCSDFPLFFGNGHTICRTLGFTYDSEILHAAGMQAYGAPTSTEIIEILCFSDNENFESCQHRFGSCTRPGVYIRCTAPGNDSVRLVGGSSTFQGQIQIYRDYSWQGICSLGWDTVDGAVLCRELGFPNVSSISGSSGSIKSYFGFALSSVECVGNETYLSVCPAQISTEMCGRNDSAFVVCEIIEQFQVRLRYAVDNERNISGLVEVFVGMEWLGICDDDWGLSDAEVVCRSLGYDFPLEVINSYAIIQASEAWNRVNCVGNETNLGECGYTNTTVSTSLFASCYLTEGAGVTCGKYVEYDVRFREQTVISDNLRGIVEVLIGGGWYPICDSGLNISQYLCDELGLSQATEFYSKPFSQLSQISQSINNITCLDNGMSLMECQSTFGPVVYCSSAKAIGVSCVELDGRIRLVDGNDTAGHVQIFHGGEWGDVCDDFWGLPDADVVCRQLGQRGALSATLTSAFGRRAVNFLLDNVRCAGTESRLISCPSNGIGEHNCLNYELAGVHCIPDDCPTLPAPGNGTVIQDSEHLGFANFFCEGSYKLVGEGRIQCLWSVWDGIVPECVTAQEGDVQLVDGGSSLEGHVQIFHSGQWGYVCDNEWGVTDGEVVCTQLKYAPNVRGISISSFYPNRTNVSQIWLNDVQCSGSEGQLSDCLGADYVPHSCDGRELAGVECFANEGRLRLTEGTSDRNGLLQIYLNGSWHYFCYFAFSGVGQACSQLGFQATGYRQPREVNVTEIYAARCSSYHTYLYPHCDIAATPICFLNLAVNLTCTVDDECRVRLSEGSYKGVVEFWKDGKWGGVCKDGINLETANIICKQLGWLDGASSVSYDVINGGALPFHYQSVSCSSNQTDICNCTMDSVFTSKCTRDQALFVECILPADGTLRLADGNSDTSGILEIFHEERWGSVCDDSFKSASANVACRQMGFKVSKTVVLGRRILSEFWLDDVQCYGNEQYLSNCSRREWGIDNCGSLEGLLLECTPYVEGELILTHRVFTERIVTARVQIRYNKLWYNICPQQITDAFANQICTHFDLPDDISVSTAIEMNRTVDSSPDSISILSCPLDFENLPECLESVSCSTDKVLAIRCSSFENQTRLITSTGYSGTIQINHELSWRGICDDGWDINDATVACKQLGFAGALEALSSIYGETDSFWLTNVGCAGNERYLDHCAFESWAVSNCLRFEYAGVVCQPNNCNVFPNISNGMFYGNTTHGSVIELNCDANHVENGARTVVCNHGEWVGAMPSCVLAQELSLRLIGSDDFHQGYVQIYHNGKWGYICDTTWGEIAAETACIQLGFEALQSLAVQNYHGNTSGSSWSDDVQCNQGDRSFAECDINFLNPANCTNLAGVKCVELEGDVMLVNGTNTSSEHSGWVQIYVQGTYHPVCSSGFGDEEIGVICRQLGFSKGELVMYGGAALSYSDLRFNCDGDEDRVRECTQYELSGANCIRLGAFINCTYEDFGAFRLIDGAYGYEGILEVHLNTSWSAVCYDRELSQDTMDGICNILGWQYGGKSIMSTRSYSEVGVQVSISSCSVGAKDSSDCQLNTSSSSCDRKNAMYISCYPPPQNTLRRDTVNALEIFHGTRWGYVCDDLFDLKDAHVACYQLGYINATMFKLSIDVAHSFFWLDNLLCSGNEESLADCRSNNFGFENCYDGEGVTVDCVPYDNGEIRFFDDTDIPQIYLDNEFRYICADGFSIESADVICAQDDQFSAESFGSIGIESGQAKPSEFARKLSCTGSETEVINCTITDAPSCSNISTVECIDPTGMIRLLDDKSLQVYSDGWKYVCGDRWSSKDVEIVCTQLGRLNAAVDFYTLPAPSDVEYYGSRFDCYGTESRLIDCIHDKGDTCDTRNVAAASCNDLTCPHSASVISCGSRCSPACYEDSAPIGCSGCEEKCECFQDYIWNTTAQTHCIHKVNCPDLCTQNETYTCVPACQYDCRSYYTILPLICSFLPCSNGCGCKAGYVRKNGIAGECLLESECQDMSSTTTVATTPPPLNCPSNSLFTECGTACPANCSIPDTNEMLCTRQCVRSCECMNGYLLQGTECIKKENCPVTTPPPLNCPSNSLFTECGTACPANCSTSDPSEIPCTRQCVRSCECVDGYVLQGTECIKKENCPVMNCSENSQFTECGTACPANCSTSDPSEIPCTRQCVRSCQCLDGYVWLGMECVMTNTCPAEGEIIVQSTTSSTDNIMGPLQLFSRGSWYNICSNATQKAEFHALAVEKCVSISPQTNAVTLSETDSVTGVAMSLQCLDAISFNNCTYSQIYNCVYILTLACTREPVVSGGTGSNVGVVAGISASIVLAVLILVILVIVALIAILLIRRKNKGKAYKQFEPKFSVASEYAEPGEEAPSITNPIYQIRDLETEKLVTEDNSVIAD